MSNKQLIALRKELKEYKKQHRDLVSLADLLTTEQEEFLKLLCKLANGETNVDELAFFLRKYYPRTSKELLLREPLRKVGVKFAEFRLRPEVYMPKLRLPKK